MPETSDARAIASSLIKKLKSEQKAASTGTPSLLPLIVVAERLFDAGRFQSVERLLRSRIKTLEKMKVKKANQDSRRAEKKAAKERRGDQRFGARRVRKVKLQSAATFSSFLQNARINAGITQLEIATHLGQPNPMYVSNIERGIVSPSVEMAIRMVDFYRASRDELYNFMLDEYKRQLKKKFEI